MYFMELYIIIMCIEMLILVFVFGKNVFFIFCLNMEMCFLCIINIIKELNFVVMFYIYGNESIIL